MSMDDRTEALMADVDAIAARYQAQLRADPDHLVALEMIGADYRRAEKRLSEHLALRASLMPVRRYVDGRRVEA